SVAYSSPRPPLKITTSSGLAGSTPSGFDAEVAAGLPDAAGAAPPPLVAHALSRPAAGPAASAVRPMRRKSCRRVMAPGVSAVWGMPTLPGGGSIRKLAYSFGGTYVRPARSVKRDAPSRDRPVAVPPTRRDLPVRGGHGDVRGRPRRPPRMSP